MLEIILALIQVTGNLREKNELTETNYKKNIYHKIKQNYKTLLCLRT